MQERGSYTAIDYHSYGQSISLSHAQTSLIEWDIRVYNKQSEHCATALYLVDSQLGTFIKQLIN